MRGGKTQNSVGSAQGRNQIANRNSSHMTSEGLRNSAAFQVQNIPTGVMMQPQRSYMPGHPVAIPTQRPTRQGGRGVYSSSPQGPPVHYVPQQQNVAYTGMIPHQDQYQSMSRPYAQPVHAQVPYQYQTPHFQPPYVQQATTPYYQHVPMGSMYFLSQPQQSPPPQQQQQQQQQQPQQSAGSSLGIPGTNHLNKATERAKPKRTNKITIRDPKDNKDITQEILSHGNHSPGTYSKSSGTSFTSTAQTDSSSIQATFAAQVAAAAVESKQTKDKEKEPDKNSKVVQISKPQPSQPIDPNLEQVAKPEEILNESKKVNKEQSVVTEMSTPLIVSHEHEEHRSESEATNVGNSAEDIPEVNTDTCKPRAEPSDERTEVLTNTKQESLPDEGWLVGDDKSGNTMLNDGSDAGIQQQNDNAKVEPKLKLLKADKESETMNGTAELSNKIISQSSDNRESTTMDTNGESDSGPQGIKEVKKDMLILMEDRNNVHDNAETGSISKLEDMQSSGGNNEQSSTPITTSLKNGIERTAVDNSDSNISENKEITPDELDQPLEHGDVGDESNVQEIPSTSASLPQQQQQQQQQKPGDPPPKKKSKQRFKEINKKESGGSLMDAYVDKPVPPPEPPVQEKVKAAETVSKKVEKPADEDLSWEDKGEKIGDEIKIEKERETEPVSTEQTKLKYERDFLLQFQFMQMCTEKPAGLPDIEVVLDAPISQNKINVSRGSSMSDFLPSYARQKSQGGGGRRDSRGKTQPRKIIAPVNQVPVELKKSENRWTRPQEKETELTEEEKKTAELYRIVVAILNKLTPQKFKTLVQQIMQLDIDSPERLSGVIDRIFEKAISEPVFSVAYANMCRCLFSIKVSGPDEKDVSFRKLLLNRCQKEFEKERQDEKELEEKQSQLEGLSEEEKKIKIEEMEEEAGKNKRRMLGNIKFIGELFKLKLLTETIMHDCIFKLLRAGDEESLESMCKLLFTVGKDLDSDKAKPRIQQYFDQINKIISAKKVSSRVTFMLRDVVDLRKNNWVPRREENYNPKTIDQIHKEAQMERTQEQRNANLLKDSAKQKKGGGGRDSPKPMSSSNDGWIVSGKSGKPVALDPIKLKSMGKRANADEKISLGPTGRFGQWGRGSTGGLGAAGSSSQEQETQGNRFSALSGGDGMVTNRPYDPRKPPASGRPSSAGSRPGDRRQVKSDRVGVIEAVKSITKPQINTKVEVPQEKSAVKVTEENKEAMPEGKVSLSKEEMAKKTKPIVDEFVNIEDMEEALICFSDLNSPEVHDVFVTTAVEHTYDLTSKDRKLTGRLLNELLRQNKLAKEQFELGLNNALENAEDNAIDYPKLWCYLAEIITPVILGEQFKFSDMKPLIMHLVESNKAAVILAEILNIIARESSQEKAVLLWAESNISWSGVLRKDIKCREFLSEKNLTFLPSEIDELNKLLSQEGVTNDTVFACIEVGGSFWLSEGYALIHIRESDNIFEFIQKNFKEERRKEPEFISQLASAVAESCIINKGEVDGADCCVERLKARKNILHKYLDNNHGLELEVLFSLQTLYVEHNKPTKMLSSFFNTLYDEDVITEDSFFAWKNDTDPTRQEAKGPALQATASFFEWLQSAAVESHES